jgi:hypothetical protein
MDTNDRDAGGGLDQLVSGLYSLVKKVEDVAVSKTNGGSKNKRIVQK